MIQLSDKEIDYNYEQIALLFVCRAKLRIYGRHQRLKENCWANQTNIQMFYMT